MQISSVLPKRKLKYFSHNAKLYDIGIFSYSSLLCFTRWNYTEVKRYVKLQNSNAFNLRGFPVSLLFYSSMELQKIGNEAVGTEC